MTQGSVLNSFLFFNRHYSLAYFIKVHDSWLLQPLLQPGPLLWASDLFIQIPSYIPNLMYELTMTTSELLISAPYISPPAIFLFQLMATPFPRCLDPWSYPCPHHSVEENILGRAWWSHMIKGTCIPEWTTVAQKSWTTYLWNVTWWERSSNSYEPGLNLRLIARSSSPQQLT